MHRQTKNTICHVLKHFVPLSKLCGYCTTPFCPSSPRSATIQTIVEEKKINIQIPNPPPAPSFPTFPNLSASQWNLVSFVKLSKLSKAIAEVDKVFKSYLKTYQSRTTLSQSGFSVLWEPLTEELKTRTEYQEWSIQNYAVYFAWTLN